MVTDPRHKGNLSSPRFSQLTKQIPHWFQFTFLLRVHSCVGNISSEKHEVKWVGEMASCELLRYIVTQRHYGSHIPEHSDIYSIQILTKHWWGSEHVHL